MDKSIYLFGCGGHARSIISAVKRKKPEKKIVLVDNNCKENEEILSCMTMKENDFFEQRELEFFYIIGIGNNDRRSVYYKKLKSMGGIAINVMASSSIIGTEATIGEAVYIGERAFIGPETQIGNNTIINTAAIIEHECRIGENVHIAPNTTVCGRCFVGDNTFVGANSVVIDKIKIAENVVIGAGSVVEKDITESGIYVGCPARRIR